MPRPQEKVSLKPLSFKQALTGLLEVDAEAVEPEKAEKPKPISHQETASLTSLESRGLA